MGKIRYNACAGFFKRIKNIPYAIVKGEPLSLYCYGEVGCRTSCDIDILISAKYVNQVESILVDEGFIQKKVGENDKERRVNSIYCLMHTHQTLPFEKEVGCYNVEIDVNFNILWNSRIDIDIEKFLMNTEEINVYGQVIKCLQIGEAFVQMCLHHYKEMNGIYFIVSKKRINTTHLKEVYYFLFNNRKLSPHDIETISDALGVKKYIYYMIYYANKVVNNNFLEPYLNRLYSKEGEYLLDKYGLTEQTQKKWKFSFEELIVCEDLSQLIENDLTQEDRKRIEMDFAIFGNIV